MKQHIYCRPPTCLSTRMQSLFWSGLALNVFPPSLKMENRGCLFSGSSLSMTVSLPISSSSLWFSFTLISYFPRERKEKAKIIQNVGKHGTRSPILLNFFKHQVIRSPECQEVSAYYCWKMPCCHWCLWWWWGPWWCWGSQRAFHSCPSLPPSAHTDSFSPGPGWLSWRWSYLSSDRGGVIVLSLMSPLCQV